MWRMDSLSVGISILCGWAKDQATRVADCQQCGLLVAPIAIAGNSDRDWLEMVITMIWNG
jgi:hypothetical protein